MAEEKQEKQGAKKGPPAAAGKGGDGKAAQQKGKGQQAGRKEVKEAGPRSFARPKDYRPRMKSHYDKVVREALIKKFSYKNPMQVPRLEKIVLNMGVGEAVNDRKKVENAAADLALISGQKPVVTRARKSIA